MSVFEIFNISVYYYNILWPRFLRAALRYEKLDRHHIMPGCQEMMH